MVCIHYILSLLSMAAFVGLIKPYINGFHRKHFLAAMIGLMVANAATLPFVPAQSHGTGPQTPEPDNTDVADGANDAKKANPDEMSPLVVGMSLKAAARDPDSLVIDEAWANSSKTFVCVEYRARNGFGGMNREHAVFTKLGGDTSARAWNKRCTSDDLKEVTYEVRSGTELNAK